MFWLGLRCNQSSANERKRTEGIHKTYGRAGQGHISAEKRFWSLVCEHRNDRRQVANLTKDWRVSKKRELSHPQNTRIQHAKLRYDRKHNRFWLNIVVEREVPEVEPTGRVVGVNLGIQNLATCSNRLRFSGKQAQHMRRRFINLRRALQKKGTKGAKRTLKRLSGREKRITSSINHLIARRIVDSLNSGDTLVMEKLTGIRERARVRKHQRYIHHRWAFAQLQAYIRYKALEKGICVALVDPRHTRGTKGVRAKRHA